VDRKAQPRKRTCPIKLDADQLEAARQGGLLHTTLDEIALKLGVSPSSLDNWLTNEAHPFTKAYRSGRADANAVVQKALLTSAAHGNVQAIIWYMKQYLGAVDNPQTIVNVSSSSGSGAIPSSLTMTDAQKKELDRMALAIQRRALTRARQEPAE
jgi:predicted DNA-binding protein (UPF0251 family)